MKIGMGDTKLSKSWDKKKFSDSIECPHCKKGIAKVVFVFYEDGTESDYVYEMNNNDPEKDILWFKDLISGAVYACTSCLKGSVVFTQAE